MISKSAIGGSVGMFVVSFLTFAKEIVLTTIILNLLSNILFKLGILLKGLMRRIGTIAILALFGLGKSISIPIAVTSLV